MPNPRKNLKVTTIIPVYNEAVNITRVLEPLRQVEAIREIIVVDDGSSDDIASVVKASGVAKLISLPQNMGKTKAVLRGVEESGYPTIMTCDADLVNLTQDHVQDLIEKYRQGYDMVIMDKGSQPWVFRRLLKSVPALSGTRILAKDLFQKIPFKESDQFQLEIRINDYFLAHGLSIGVTPAAEVYDPRKYVKYPFLIGLKLDLRGGLQVLASDGPISIFKNLADFRRIKDLAADPKRLTDADRDKRRGGVAWPKKLRPFF